ncbi:MAG: DUF4177 domain-containing protein [Muribaculaceae bacterium]|nr:DUF4177 domain-containing protein [Muribaculaceae bacterium]
MDKWEYKILEIKQDNEYWVNKRLNDAGNEGWELVTFTNYQESSYMGEKEYSMVCIFKRKIQ